VATDTHDDLTPRTRHEFARVNGIRLHYVVAGSGPTVILLHGFPETHRSWDLQLPALVRAGYRAVAPDLRGYGESERPRRGYDLDTLAADIAGLVDHLGADRVSVIGHDWGGALAWQLASRHADRLLRAVVLDCPHPALMARALRTNPEQRRRSWYMFFFQLPMLPERWLLKDGAANVARMFREGSPGADRAPPSIIQANQRALSEPGAARAAIAYYRASFRAGLRPLLRGELDASYAPIELPLTLIWGEADSCLGLELIDGTEKYAKRLRVHRVPDAGHFVHQESPDVVNRLLLDALRENVS
jgi:epoxide hydrolase 4